MQSKNDKPHSNLHGPAWHLQIEFLLPGCENQMTELVLGSLIQAVQDLGVPPVILQRIKASLTKATWNTKRYTDEAGLALPLYLRLFTQVGQPSHESKSTQVSFEVNENQDGTYPYFCTQAGHRQMGQEGKLIVGDP